MMSTLPQRVEQKYYVAPDAMILALGLVRRNCRWDSQYPEEQINSLYFDTPDLEQHEKSLAGEFAKSKVRIRWYGVDNDPHGSYGRMTEAPSAGGRVPVWLELKERRGFVSTKQRSSVDVSAGALAPDTLGDGIVPVLTLMQAMAGFGFFTTKRLCPVVAVSYWRWRFVEPRTGFRVAFDSRIRSSAVMPGIGRGERGLELPGAVIEVKGPSADTPSCLSKLKEMGSSWTRFSKYSSSLDAHASALGSVSRLWPSGGMHVGPCQGVPTSNRGVATCGSK
jgi:VTC domain